MLLLYFLPSARFPCGFAETCLRCTFFSHSCLVAAKSTLGSYLYRKSDVRLSRRSGEFFEQIHNRMGKAEKKPGEGESETYSDSTTNLEVTQPQGFAVKVPFISPLPAFPSSVHIHEDIHFVSFHGICTQQQF